MADRIRQSVADHAFGAERGLEPAAHRLDRGRHLPAHGDSRERLLDLADKAMYLAKALGRNQVCSADDLSTRRRGLPGGGVTPFDPSAGPW